MAPVDRKGKGNFLYQILIFSGSLEGKRLIEEIASHYKSLGQYDVIFEEEKFIPEWVRGERRFKFYKFEFFNTQYRQLLDREYNKIIIAVKHKMKAFHILEQLQKDPFAIITFVNYWGEELELPPNVELIDVSELIVHKLVDAIPGVPAVARDIGLGIGEIMEVEVPPGSQFVYKQAAGIYNPKRARVALIYRRNRPLLPNSRMVILPHDRLLLVGHPNHLEILFRQIKEQIGTFPVPFGNNLLLILDMVNMERREILGLLNSAFYLHKKLNNRKLLIRIINPTFSYSLTRIYNYYRDPLIDIYTFYDSSTTYEKLLKRAKQEDVGLILTTSKFFYRCSREFFNLKIPVFKEGEQSMKNCSELIALLQPGRYFRETIPVIFDISFQLEKPLTFVNGDPENDYRNLKSYINHFIKMYGMKNVKFLDLKVNGVLELRKTREACLINPLHKPKWSKWLQILNPRIENSFILLDHLNQFLIPVEEV
ncbi:MAG: TrkA C-terminal domain-containing protein [Campylobacterales bacterium]